MGKFGPQRGEQLHAGALRVDVVGTFAKCFFRVIFAERCYLSDSRVSKNSITISFFLLLEM